MKFSILGRDSVHQGSDKGTSIENTGDVMSMHRMLNEIMNDGKHAYNE